jgi:hypothetical protein
MGLRGGSFENAIRGKAIPVLRWIAHGGQIESCDLFKRPGYFVVALARRCARVPPELQEVRVCRDAPVVRSSSQRTANLRFRTMRTHLKRRAKFRKAIPLASQKQRSDWGRRLGRKESNVLTWESRRGYHFESRRSRGTKRRLGSTDDKNPRKTARGHRARCPSEMGADRVRIPSDEFSIFSNQSKRGEADPSLRSG